MKREEDEVRKEIRIYELNQKLLQNRKEINLEILELMKKNPKKLEPDFEYETTPEFLVWCKKKWESDIELENMRLEQQIGQSGQQIDIIRESLKKEENKVKSKEGEKHE